MKLCLTSYRVPDPEKLLELLTRPLLECKVAIIPNAKDYKLPNERAESIDELIVYLGGWGLKSEVVDLRDYDDPDLLKSALENSDLIWVAGGNSFMLRQEMQRSGFDKVAPELLANKDIVYVGESAGAIVAGTTLEGSETADDPGLADEVIKDGLRLVNKIIVPHADSPDFLEYINNMRKTHPNSDNLVYLNDNQALLVNGDYSEIITG